MGRNLDAYHTVIASPLRRCQETAELLTGQKPVVDERAGLNKTATPEDIREIDELAKTDQFGSAGVIFKSEKFIQYMEPIGEQLASCIVETLRSLPPGKHALIVSHDATMEAAKRILKGEPITVGELEQSYGFLEGFTVTETLHVEELRIPNAT